MKDFLEKEIVNEINQVHLEGGEVRGTVGRFFLQRDQEGKVLSLFGSQKSKRAVVMCSGDTFTLLGTVGFLWLL